MKVRAAPNRRRADGDRTGDQWRRALPPPAVAEESPLAALPAPESPLAEPVQPNGPVSAALHEAGATAIGPRLPPDPGLYAILGLDPSVSDVVVQTTYRRLAARLLSSGAHDNARLRQLNVAYEVLGNPVRRAEYDRARTAHLLAPVTGGHHGRRRAVRVSRAADGRDHAATALAGWRRLVSWWWSRSRSVAARDHSRLRATCLPEALSAHPGRERAGSTPRSPGHGHSARSKPTIRRVGRSFAESTSRCRARPGPEHTREHPDPCAATASQPPTRRSGEGRISHHATLARHGQRQTDASGAVFDYVNVGQASPVSLRYKWLPTTMSS